jgi:integrase
MARSTAKLASTKVTALLKAGNKGSFADGGNLYLQVTGPGNGSWLFRYTERGSGAKGGKQRNRWLGLGPTHTVSLAEAREKAKALRQQLLAGEDPAAKRKEAKQPAKGALTFAEVADLYISAQEPGWSSAVHARQWRSSLRDHVTPIIGSSLVSVIETGDVMRVLEPIWVKKTETASRARQRVEAILDYAKSRGWRAGENPARWKGHLSNLLAAKEKVAPVVHHPSLDWDKVPDFMILLSGRQGMAAKAIAFLILTATRSAEARAATWGEIDLDRAIWAIPGSRMKARADHRIPLSAAAVQILRTVQPATVDPAAFIFPGGKEGRPLSDVGLAKLLPVGVTLHGFRSSFRTWAGEKTAYAREVIEMALAHRLGDSVEQAYARGDLFQRRRALMEAWAAHCSGETLIGAGKENVVTLRAGAAA